MTLTNTTFTQTFQGNGATTLFNYTFPIPLASYVQAVYVAADGTRTTLPSNQYTITGLGNVAGGTITYPLSGPAMAVGTSLVLSRVLPLTQLFTLANQGGFYPDVVDAALDYITMLVQQLAGGTFSVDVTLNNANLTGIPTADTAPVDTDTAQLATTAFVVAQIAATPVVSISPSNANPVMDGAAAPGASALYSRGDHVHPSDTSRATLASPVFTGDPKAPTPSPGDNDTSLATTAFVAAAVAAAGIVGALVDVQYISATGTYTRAAGVTTALVIAQAGGGGGGGASAGQAGGGGGAGELRIGKVSPGATETVTIPAAAAGATGSAAGATAADVTFGSLLTAKGGTGGAAGPAGAAGTTPAGTTGIALPSPRAATAGSGSNGGQGGMPMWGGIPAPGGTNGTNASVTIHGFGVGGGGGGSGGGTSNGGNGSVGYVIVIGFK